MVFQFVQVWQLESAQLKGGVVVSEFLGEVLELLKAHGFLLGRFFHLKRNVFFVLSI